MIKFLTGAVVGAIALFAAAWTWFARAGNKPEPPMETEE